MQEHSLLSELLSPLSYFSLYLQNKQYLWSGINKTKANKIQTIHILSFNIKHRFTENKIYSTSIDNQKFMIIEGYQGDGNLKSENTKILTNITTNIKLVPQRGWWQLCFLTFSTVRGKPFS